MGDQEISFNYVSNLVPELISYIEKFVISYNDNYDILNEIKDDIMKSIKLYLVFQKNKTYQYINKKKKAFQLIMKYGSYQSDYEYHIRLKRKGYPSEPSYFQICNPILLDILFTGCNLPYADHSLDYFTRDTFDDLKEIISIFPSCLESTYGRLRCRFNVMPLHAACINSNIPVYVIHYLLKKGANKNKKILVNGYGCHILEDMENSNRKKQIEHLFDP